MTRFGNDNANFFRGCSLCPRACRVDRTTQKRGFCREGDQIRLALACRHFGEEPLLTGSGGSGTIFFSGCTLGCPFCQNHRISRGELGREVTIGEFSAILLALQERGAQNANMVTGTHFSPNIAEGVQDARSRGLEVPVVWNTSGYESRRGLELIGAFSDVFLPDIKTLDRSTAAVLFGTPDYPDVATEAVEWMASQKEIEFDPNGMLTSGTIVRHLVLPGYVDRTRRVIDWFAEKLLGRALLSVMFQYIPPVHPGNPATALDRGVDEVEYCRVLSMLEESGIEDGYIQERVPIREPESQWRPDFDSREPFPQGYSDTVWHWKNGF